MHPSVSVDAKGFATLQERLGPALEANRAGSGVDHVLIALPSYSVSESLLSHYGDRVASLEHRYLNALIMPNRIESCEFVFVSTKRPAPEVVEYYVSLVPEARQARVRSRMHLYEVDDGTARSVASKLLDRPDLLAALRTKVGGRPALIEPWNVTPAEVELAVALNVPINGTSPELRQLGFKSDGRRLFRDAGVPIPEGREDIRTVDDAVGAIESIGAARLGLKGVVIKHDDSGAGDGNVVIDLTPLEGLDEESARAWVEDRIRALPGWYLDDLAKGGVVEERIAGARFTSPSAQVDIRPTGEVTVLATHEQVLGGEGGQVYLGCRFPADADYAPELARHAARIGESLRAAGAIGRFSVDFVAAADPAGPWRLYVLEINLRKGGTTHPYAALRNLVPGHYDAEAGRWVVAADGTSRAYSATDNLVDPRWQGLPPADVIAAVREAGLQFEPAAGTGTILHMLSGLAIDGRLGLTAIAGTPAEADELHEATRRAIERLAGR